MKYPRHLKYSVLIIITLTFLSLPTYAQSISASQIISILKDQNDSKAIDMLKSMGFKKMSSESENGSVVTSFLKSKDDELEHLELGKNLELYMLVYKPSNNDVYNTYKEMFVTSDYEYSYSFKNANYYESQEMRIGLNDQSSIISFFVPLKRVGEASSKPTNSALEEHMKQEEELMRKANEKTNSKKLKPSIFGTKSTTYGSYGTNYDSYADGKYSKVAKAENWSKWSIPPDKDERLEAYERKQLIKYILLGAVVLALVFIVARKLLKSRA